MIEDWERDHHELLEAASDADVQRLLGEVASSGSATLYLGPKVVGLHPPWIAFSPGTVGRFEVLAGTSDLGPVLVPKCDVAGDTTIFGQQGAFTVPASETLELDEVRAVTAYFLDRLELDPKLVWDRRDPR